MPKVKGDALITRSVSLTQDTWDELATLGDLVGIREAEMYRRVITLGTIAIKEELRAVIAYENAQLVNQKLRWRSEKTMQVLEELKLVCEQVPDLTTLSILCSRLEQCLTD